jgi:phosphoribosyl 1,2-cyclic phosphodiesterase
VRAIVRGCRGSLATPGQHTLRRGGNTSCVEVRLADGTLLILDAGTGIRELGLELAASPGRTIHLLLTHLHLDHLEGLGFFVPLWQPETELHIWGPSSTFDSLRARIARFLAPPFFPVLLADAPSEITFHDVPREPWTIGSATIAAQPILHPGPTVGYRVEADGGVLAYLPDHEPYLGGELHDMGTDWISGFDVAAGADVLMHDAQYTEAEYPAKVGWGHSSVAQAVEFARVTGVGQLVLFHHDPLHDEEQLDALEARAVELWNREGKPPILAVEGAEHVLGSRDGAQRVGEHRLRLPFHA